MRDELALHFDLHVKSLEARGMSRVDARRQAAIDFAGMEQVKEAYREARGIRPLESVLRDIRYAVRTLTHQRAFTAAVVLTFAIGIGATTAIYSLVDGAWFGWSRAFPQSDRLVTIYEVFGNGGYGSTSPVDFRDWREQARAFDGITAYMRGAATLVAEGEPVRRASASVGHEFFSVLRVRPAVGRFFRPEEEQWGNNGRVVLSYSLWRRDFGGDSAVVGRKVTLNGGPAEIIGVAPPGAWFGSGAPDLYLPMSFAPNDGINGRRNHFVGVIGRLAPGQTANSAAADLTGVVKRVASLNPDTDAAGARVVSLLDTVLLDLKPILIILLGAAALVLLIACANVTNLLLVRTIARARELSVRAALGASRPRLVQQLWTESVVLAFAGGALGVAVAAGIVRWFAATMPIELPRVAETGVSVDGRVLAISLAVVFVTGLVCGSLPALQITRGAGASDALRGGGRGMSGGRRAAFVRGGLVSAQVGLALVLLIVTGLLTRSLNRMRAEDPGAKLEGVLTVRLALPANVRTDSAGAIRYYDDVMRRVSAVPGVSLAGVASHLPMSGGGETKSFWVEGRQPASLDDVPRVVGRMESVDALRAMGVTLLAGRWFEASDRDLAPYVAIIGESVARKYFAGENPIGKRISLFPPEPLAPNPRPRPRFIVIGVVRDVQYQDASAPREDAVYVNYAQGRRVWLWGPEWLVVKTTQPPAAIGGPIRNALRAVNASLPVGAVVPLEEQVAQSFRAPGFTARLIATFATVAVVLAIIGLYGVIAYSVAQETRSIGVRLALGAAPGEVVSLVVRRGGVLATAGVLGGVAAAVAATKLVESQLFGVSPLDPGTYGVAGAAMLALAIGASWIPARRAASTDALIALRSD